MQGKSIQMLYEVHGPAILLFLRRFVSDSDAAADLLQETFAIALASESELQKAISARAWLFGVARNLAHNSIRRKRPISALGADPPAAETESDERLERMREAIDGLPNILRETLQLKLQQDLSYEEIAAVLSIPVGTVRSRLHHAVQRLRERLTNPSSGGEA